MITSFLKNNFPALRYPVLPAKVLFTISTLFGGFSKTPEDDTQHILIVKLDEIGDVILASGLLRELRRSYSKAKVTLVVKPALFNLVEYCPFVDEVLTFQPLQVNYKVHNLFGALKFFRQFLSYLFRALNFSRSFLLQNNFDMALLPRWDIDHMFSSIVIFFSNARVRVAYSEHVNQMKALKNHNSDKLFTMLLDDRKLRHEVEHILNMGREIGITIQNENLEIWKTPDDDCHVAAFLTQNNVDDHARLILCCPGAGALKKRWPIERFGVVCSWLHQEYGAKVVIVGSADEKELGSELRRMCRSEVIDTVGMLSLRQTASMLKRCSLYFGNDTGIMHMAAALKLPVVAIFCHPKSCDEFHFSPKRFGPWGTRSVILQPEVPTSPCSQWCDAESSHCIKAIQTNDVQRAIRELLQLHPSSL